MAHEELITHMRGREREMSRKKVDKRGGMGKEKRGKEEGKNGSNGGEKEEKRKRNK